MALKQPMTDEKYDELAATIASGKVVYFSGYSASTGAELDRVRELSNKSTASAPEGDKLTVTRAEYDAALATHTAAATGDLQKQLNAASADAAAQKKRADDLQAQIDAAGKGK
jgi:hypothetical protein